MFKTISLPETRIANNPCQRLINWLSLGMVGFDVKHLT